MSVRLTLSTRGLAFASRMRPAGVQRLMVDVSIDAQRVVIGDYTSPGAIGTYERGSVRIEGPSGTVRDFRSNGRPRVGKLWWDDLDLLYFVGCALWNYVAIPTILWQLPHRELAAWDEGHRRWRRIQVRFPPEILTHSGVQTFYLDDDDRIMRHDYVAEVFGKWALAAHYGRDHVALGDHWLATRRRVVPRTPAGRALPGPTLVSIALDEVHEEGLGLEARPVHPRTATGDHQAAPPISSKGSSR